MTRGLVLAIAGFVIPVGGIGEPKVFILLAALLLIFVLLWLGCKDGRALPSFPWKAAWLASAILLWAGASYWWSLDPERSLQKFLDLSVIAIAALILMGTERVLSVQDRRNFAIALGSGVMVVFLVQWSEIATQGALMRVVHEIEGDSPIRALSKLVRGISVATLLIWPAMICLRRAGLGRWSLALGLLGVVTLWASTATAAALAMTMGIAAFVVFVRLPVAAVRVLAVLAAAWVIAIPIIMSELTTRIDPHRYTQDKKNVSVVHRLFIWQFTSRKIKERPWLGVGLRAGRKIPGGEKLIEIGQGERPARVQIFSVHPHNGPLEWWLELGFLGAALGALVVFLLFRWPERIGDPVVRAYLIGTLTTGFGIFNASFGAWQSWWLMALSLTVFMTMISIEGSEVEDDAPAVGKTNRIINGSSA